VQGENKTTCVGGVRCAVCMCTSAPRVVVVYHGGWRCNTVEGGGCTTTDPPQKQDFREDRRDVVTGKRSDQEGCPLTSCEFCSTHSTDRLALSHSFYEKMIGSTNENLRKINVARYHPYIISPSNQKESLKMNIN